MNKYMEEALKEAKKAYSKNEVPVGCVIVKDKKIIARGHNNKEIKKNILGHAEINGIKKASKKEKGWQLNNCEMYVTLLPCKICQYIIKESRIKKVYYLLDNDKTKAEISNIERTNDCSDLVETYQSLLKKFFEKLRK